ncbi:MAG: type IV pilus modification protein PilV [Halomonas sp.]|uniref:type IV pilus modification protein PilV n=1 Tax=unclassified Halomonas TaxID=2609666 RepID=UPI002653DE2A|nr:type IV pilus modification protein PilV [Halomonas sp.]
MAQRGFSLIEALIALVVLSVGLLGVAAMQFKALQSAHDGYQRSLASVAAVDAQERLWAELAMLDPDQTCENIDSSAVQTKWRAHWFQGDDSSPLRDAIEAQSAIEPVDGDESCLFRVILELDYLFRLPNLEAVP